MSSILKNLGSFNKKSNDVDYFVKMLGIDAIVVDSRQVRKQFDKEKLDELRDSIIKQGVISPIVVRPNGDSYQIIAGERRYRAAKDAGLKEVPCLVKDDLTEMEVKTLQLIENLQREDLTALETARGFGALLKEKMTQKQISVELGMNKSTVHRYVKILDLPKEWLDNIQDVAPHATLKELYAIANQKNKGHQSRMYKKLLAKYDEDFEIEEEKEEVVEEGLSSYQKDQLYEAIKKIARKDKDQLVKYIKPSKIKELLEMVG